VLGYAHGIPAGACLITRTPRLVAASRSILSTPTPRAPPRAIWAQAPLVRPSLSWSCERSAHPRLRSPAFRVIFRREDHVPPAVPAAAGLRGSLIFVRHDDFHRVPDILLWFICKIEVNHVSDPARHCQIAA